MKTKTIKLEGTIYLDTSETIFNPYGFIEIDFDDDWWKTGKTKRIPLAPYTIEIDKPEGFDPTKEVLKSLQVQRKLILAENEKRLNQIDRQIQELQAIEHKP
jgi:hypothetical protein